MRIAHSQETAYRHRVMKISTEHRQGGAATARTEAECDDFEFAHARRLVFESSDAAFEARQKAQSLRGLPA
jgi:hypothetical protein